MLSCHNFLLKSAGDTGSDKAKQRSFDAVSVSDRVLTPEDADDIKQKLRPAEEKFYKLGMKLLESKEVHDITLMHLGTHESLSRVIDKFLKHEEKKPTWKKIFNALRSPAVGMEQLAAKLRADLEQTSGIINFL